MERNEPSAKRTMDVFGAHAAERHSSSAGWPTSSVTQKTVDDGAKRRKGSKAHLAVDTLGHLPALHVTPADQQDRAQVERLAEAGQQATDENVELVYVDQGYTGEAPAQAAQQHGIQLEVVKLPEAKKGFVLLPKRWAVERSFGWASRFRRLARDYERLPETVAGLHLVAFACLFLKRFVSALTPS